MINSFKCLICGYIHQGEEPPENCPICGVPSTEFESFNEQGTLLKADIKQESSASSLSEKRIVILGSGIAGITAAEEIRRNTAEAEIIMISSESHLPYYRLNLTRYIADEVDQTSLPIHPNAWYKKNNIALLLGKQVLAIDRDKKEIELDDKRLIKYDKLIMSMGAHPFIPPIPGSTLKNVMTIRNIEDAEYLLKSIPDLQSCVCIGGGILGLEAAVAVAKHGVQVTLLEGAKWLMPAQINAKASLLLEKYLLKMSVTAISNIRIKEITGEEYCEEIAFESNEIGPMQEVMCMQEEISSPLIIITAGVRPNTYLARKAGLEVDKGIIVNNAMQTSDSDIFAIGDVAEHYGVLYGLWNVAQYQGKVAAQNILGLSTQFGGIPRSNVLKVVGLDMFSIGLFSPPDGSYSYYEEENEESYYAFVLRDNKLVGSIVIGDPSLAFAVKQAVEKEVYFPHQTYNHIKVITKKLREMSN